MSGEVLVAGVGAHPWGKWPDKPQLALALHAIDAALGDAGLGWPDVGALVAASSRFEGGMGWGLHANEVAQAVAEQPMACINVGGACAAGVIAFHTAANLIASGECEVAVAFGAERMPKGFIPRPPGGADDITDSDYLRWVAMGATNPAYWAIEAMRRRAEHGTTDETLARAAQLMRRQAADNPLARFRDPLTIEQVLASPMVADPLHLLEICPVSDGAAAVVLCSPQVARRTGARTARIAGSAIGSGAFGDPARRIPSIASTVTGGTIHTSEVMSAARIALDRAGLSPADVDVLEMADNSAWHLLAWPELLGLCEAGQADWLIDHDGFGRDGIAALNPSGGFLSFGEATTAQALLQICELVWQVRGDAGRRQVEGARVAMSAVLGLGANGGSVVLTA